MATYMYKPFDPNIKPMSPDHDCFSHKPTFEKRDSFQSPTALTRPVSKEDKADLKETSEELVKGGSDNAFGAVSCHGFSDELIEVRATVTLKDVVE